MLVRRMRLAVLSLVSPGRKVAGGLSGIVVLDLCTNILVSSTAGRKDRLREGGWRCREDTLVGWVIVAVIAVSSSPQSSKVQLESLLWVYVWIHGC